MGRYRNFNPRTREGCDHRAVSDVVLPPWISIHAPVKGATGGAPLTEDLAYISIHAPVKGATLAVLDEIKTALTFQSTHP